jgi:ketopantoate hydroxymethyltransferase
MTEEYTRNPSVTVGEVIREIWSDLDVALVGMSDRHKDARVRVMQDVLRGFRISSQTPNTVEQYLAQLDKQTLQESVGRR